MGRPPRLQSTNTIELQPPRTPKSPQDALLLHREYTYVCGILCTQQRIQLTIVPMHIRGIRHFQKVLILLRITLLPTLRGLDSTNSPCSDSLNSANAWGRPSFPLCKRRTPREIIKPYRQDALAKSPNASSHSSNSITPHTISTHILRTISSKPSFHKVKIPPLPTSSKRCCSTRCCAVAGWWAPCTSCKDSGNVMQGRSVFPLPPTSLRPHFFHKRTCFYGDAVEYWAEENPRPSASSRYSRIACCVYRRMKSSPFICRAYHPFPLLSVMMAKMKTGFKAITVPSAATLCLWDIDPQLTPGRLRE